MTVDGHRLYLTHLGKTLFPASGHTKAEVLRYYTSVAAAMLAHTRGRPASFVRAPEGARGERWYAKNPPPGTPKWVTTTPVPGRGDATRHVVVDSVASLIALVNLGAYEIHVPQWNSTDGPDGHDRLVFDLDPGPGADLATCCAIALRLRQLLADDGLCAFPVVSGSKGLHLYAPVPPTTGHAASRRARDVAARLRDEHPGLVVVEMTRAARAGKVLIDWSQNATAKTTAAPYTLRLGPSPAVAAPVTWEEVAGCRRPEDLAYSMDQVRARVSAGIDPAAGREATGRRDAGG